LKNLEADLLEREIGQIIDDKVVERGAKTLNSVMGKIFN
jgi:hypothetical protein